MTTLLQQLNSFEISMKNSVTILGTGTSTGTPQLGCSCKVCTSSDPRDKRLRTSLLIHTKQNKTIIIDTTPDLRTQLLSHSVMDIDGGIITHDHADHLHGIDDLRPYCFGPPKKDIPILCSTEIAPRLKERFPYIFKAEEIFNEKRPILGGGIPHLRMVEEELSCHELRSVNFIGEEFYFFNLPHGHTTTTGLYHQGLCYIPDCSSISSGLIDQLKELHISLLIIDCLQEEVHQTHLNTEQAFNYIELINPESAGLIHMNHEISHKGLEELANSRFNHGRVSPLVDNDRFEY